MSRRARLWRVLLAIAIPALVLELTFPVLHLFMHVYNEPEEPVFAFVFTAALVSVPACAVALATRTRWSFGLGLVVSAAAAVVVAIEVAATDDGQAGLAVLQLPFFVAGAAGLAVLADRVSSRAHRVRVRTLPRP